MTINSVIEQCIEHGRVSGWEAKRQHELTVMVVRRLRPDWSDSQIEDTIDRVRAHASGENAAG